MYEFQKVGLFLLLLLKSAMCAKVREKVFKRSIKVSGPGKLLMSSWFWVHLSSRVFFLDFPHWPPSPSMETLVFFNEEEAETEDKLYYDLNKGIQMVKKRPSTQKTAHCVLYAQKSKGDYWVLVSFELHQLLFLCCRVREQNLYNFRSISTKMDK